MTDTEDAAGLPGEAAPQPLRPSRAPAEHATGPTQRTATAMPIDPHDQQHTSRPDPQDDQGDRPPSGVTAPLSAAERQRRRRARLADQMAAARILYSTPPWRDFVSPETLPRVAGCSAHDLPAIVLRELADNAADEGGASVLLADGQWTFRDSGPGIASEDVARIFSVRRDSLSAKRVRLPRRGQLGNGLRVACGFAAIHGLGITIASRGAVTRLRIDPGTGQTIVLDVEQRDTGAGCVVSIEAAGPLADERAGRLARETLAIAPNADALEYGGPSLPSWYAPDDFAGLVASAPEQSTVVDVVRSMGLRVPATVAAAAKVQAASADPSVIGQVHSALLAKHPDIDPAKIGRLGRDAFAEHLPEDFGYARKASTWTSATGAVLPVVVEAWATCERQQRKDLSAGTVHVFANRSASLTSISLRAALSNERLWLEGAGFQSQGIAVKPGRYGTIILSVITPMLPVMDAGKALDLMPMHRGVVDVLTRALAAARRLAPVDEEEGDRLTRQREQDEQDRIAGHEAAAHEKQTRAEDRANKRAAKQRADAEKARRRADALLREAEHRAAWEAEASANPLHRIAMETAEAMGVPLSIFRVQADDPFTLDSAEARRDARWFAEMADRFPLARHLRALHYAIASTGQMKPNGAPYLNDASNFAWFGRVSMLARWLGMVPWQRFRDARNAPARVFAPQTPQCASPFEFGVGGGATIPEVGLRVAVEWSAEKIVVSPPRIFLTGESAQRCRVVLWCEKASGSELIESIAQAIEGEAITGTGEAGASILFDMMHRAARDGRPLGIIVLTDFDPAGWKMAASIARKVQAWRVQQPAFAELKVQVVRAGLTVRQVTAWNLLSTPIKTTEKRAVAWRRRWNREQSEIDAALVQAPDLLRAAIMEQVARFHDPGLIGRVNKAGSEWEATAAEWLEGQPASERAAAIEEAKQSADSLEAELSETVRDTIAAIAEQVADLQPRVDALNEARDAVAALVEQEQADLRITLAAALAEGVIAPLPDLPDPALSEGDAPPLFDSEEGFAASTARLQRDQRGDVVVEGEDQGEQDEPADEA